MASSCSFSAVNTALCFNFNDYIQVYSQEKEGITQVHDAYRVSCEEFIKNPRALRIGLSEKQWVSTEKPEILMSIVPDFAIIPPSESDYWKHPPATAGVLWPR